MTTAEEQNLPDTVLLLKDKDFSYTEHPGSYTLPGEKTKDEAMAAIKEAIITFIKAIYNK